MFKHLFKLIWNKKKQNFLFLSEILVSFLVIFVLFSFLVYFYQNYKRDIGLDDQQVWSVSFSNSLKTKNTDSLRLYYDNVKFNIKALPKVLSVSLSSGNIPFSRNISSTNIEMKNKRYEKVNVNLAGEEFADVFRLKMLEGSWYNNKYVIGKYPPLVINNTLKEEIFGKGNAVGKLIGDKNPWIVIGVVSDVKEKGDYYPAGKAIYKRIDTAELKSIGTIVLRVGADADAAFESKLYKVLSNTMANANIEIVHLTDLRLQINGATKVPMIILTIVAGFLIINVALGFFGVLWYNINKRRGEIGLRRAIGASGQSVAYQIVSESLILTSVALIAGFFFAIQFPLLNVYDVPSSVYLIAMLFAAVFIYLLVFLCSLYPGNQAAAIRPAVALHEE